MSGLRGISWWRVLTLLLLAALVPVSWGVHVDGGVSVRAVTLAAAVPAVLSAAVVLALAPIRHRPLVRLALVAAVIAPQVPALSYAVPSPSPDTTGSTVLTVATLNTYGAAAASTSVATVGRRADLLVTEQTMPVLEVAISEHLGETYTVVYRGANPDGDETVVWARRDRVDVRGARDLPGASPPVALLDLAVDGHRVTAVLGRALNPVVQSLASWDRTLTAMSAEAARAGSGDSGGAVVVAGDLNATPWHPRFRAMVASGGLTDCAGARGLGLRGTWTPLPGRADWFTPLTLDHVLTRGGTCGAVGTVRIPGSDHRAVLAQVVLP